MMNYHEQHLNPYKPRNEIYLDISIRLKTLLIFGLFFYTSISFSNKLSTDESTDLIYLPFKQTILDAVNNDLWLQKNKLSQDSIEARSLVSGSLPDPKISLAVSNLAVDSFDFNQEPMTHFKIGISQMFPRGKTRQLNQLKLQQLASEQPLLRENRSMMMVQMVADLWLDAHEAQESIALINKDRELFEQLVDVAQASYTSAIGKTRQQDIIRSQLELSRLEDRLTVLAQKKEVALEKLKEWTGHSYNLDVFKVKLSTRTPNVLLDMDFENSISLSDEGLNQFNNHPIVKAMNKRIIASETNINIQKQKYKPAISVSTSYGYRDNSLNGVSRSDLFSLGVSFDVPLFTKNKQDQQVKAALSESASLETQKSLLLRKMKASFDKSKTQLNRLNQRQKLYQSQLLPLMREQAEASLTAYTNDDGDFAEVVRSRIAVLNAEIEALGINVQIQKSIIELNYFLNTEYQQILDNNTEELK